MSRAVPKFASFKPKIRPPDASSPGSPKEEKWKHENREPRPKHRHKHHSRHDCPDRIVATHPNDEKVTPEQSLTTRSIPIHSDTFMTDTDGDPTNLTYGSLHKYDVPQYHRSSAGVVLGLARSTRINREQSTTSTLVTDDGPMLADKERVRSRYAQGVAVEIPRRRIRQLGNDHQSLGLDYLPLSASHKRRRLERSEDPALMAGSSFKQIDAASTDRSDSDLTSEESDVGEDPTARAKSSVLTSRLRDDPQDIDAWRELIELQAEMVFPGQDEATYTTSQRRTVRELRLALYDKAVAQVEAGSRLELLRSKLDEGSKIWDPKTRKQQWEQAVEEKDIDPGLWIRYLDTLQADNMLTYEDMKKVFLRILKRIQTSRLARPDPRLASAQLHVFLRFMTFVRSAGYSELAVACWQGVLKLKLKTNSTTHDQALIALEESWDAEGFRVGEPYWDGIETAIPHVGRLGRFSGFARHEELLDDLRMLPGKTIDDISEHDPTVATDALHIVLYSDMADTLQAMDTDMDHAVVLDAFLAFWNLPAMPSVGLDVITPWRDDPWLGAARMPDSHVVTQSSIWSSFTSIKLPRQVSSLVRNVLTAFDKHYAGISLTTYTLALCAHHSAKEAYSLVKALLSANQADYLLYDATAQIEVLRGRHEKAQGIWSSAIEMAVKSSTSAIVLATLVHNWATYELERGDDQMACKVLARLRGSAASESESLADTDGSPRRIRPSTKLAMELDFKTGAETNLRRGDAGSSLTYICLAVLLAYLASDEPITAALTIVETYEASIKQILDSSAHNGTRATNLHAAVHQYAAELLNRHISRRKQYKPSSILPWLSSALIAHLSNQRLLDLWHKLNTTLGHLDDIVKRLDRPWTRLDASTSLSVWKTTLDLETQQFRDADSGARSPHVARALFRRALLDDKSIVRHCPTLWGMWLDFELEVARSTTTAGVAGVSRKAREAQIDQVRAVFAAGLLALPWDKGWVLRGLTTFETDEAWSLGEGQLRLVYEGLFVKELRVREELDGT